MTELSLMEDLSGQMFGRYRLINPIGEGGMAAVYKAYQADIDREVAIKVLPPQFAIDEQFVRRFQQEAQALAKLQHPHIVPIYDFGTSDRYLYLVMPYVEGGDLGDQMGKVPIDLQALTRTFTEIASALDFAHQRGIIHRDIKPGNVLLNGQGHAMLGDFGLAKMVSSKQNLTDSNMVLGSAEYMSPEQGLGRPIDHRTDIYSLGIVLYEFLTGRTPYKADTWSATIMRAISDPMLPPSQLNQAINPAMEAVIIKACAKEPRARYSSASEMMAEFQDAIVGNAISKVTTEQGASAISQWRLAAEAQEASGPSVVNASTISNYATIPSRSELDLSQQSQIKSRPSAPQPEPAQSKTLVNIGLAIFGIVAVAALTIAVMFAVQTFRDSDDPVLNAQPTAEALPTQADAADLQTIDPNAGETGPVDIPTVYPTESTEEAAGAVQTDTVAPVPEDGPQATTEAPQPAATLKPAPEMAYVACRDLALYDSCTVPGPNQQTIEGMCLENTEGLACIPDRQNAPPEGNSPPGGEPPPDGNPPQDGNRP